MERLLDKMNTTWKHISALQKVFWTRSNFVPSNENDYNLYKTHNDAFNEIVQNLKIDEQLYSEKGRQMILADYIEYIFLGRGYYSIKTVEDREEFVQSILHFVNILMCFESMTVSPNIRKAFLQELRRKIPSIANETQFQSLLSWNNKVGLKAGQSGAPKKLDKYFDSLLPKTAGGLWHELLVFAFLLMSEVGYIIPLVLTQRFIGVMIPIILTIP